MDQFSNNVLKQLFGLKDTQRILIIKTPNNNTIITRYVIGKTPVKNVLDTVINKVNIKIAAGGMPGHVDMTYYLQYDGKKLNGEKGN